MSKCIGNKHTVASDAPIFCVLYPVIIMTLINYDAIKLLNYDAIKLLNYDTIELLNYDAIKELS